MNFLDPATPEQISEFERKNGIRLPEQYREWLAFSDGGELFLPPSLTVLHQKKQRVPLIP